MNARKRYSSHLFGRITGQGLRLLGVNQAPAARPFNGQGVLITGGSRGLGLLLAKEFARQGGRVVICARDEQELRRAEDDLRQLSAQVWAIPCDVTDQAQVERLVEQATERLGQVDVLVNNAGIIQVGPLHTMTLKNYQEAMDVMYWGMVYTTMAVLPQMRSRRAGRIVNITSIGGKVSVPHLLPYCAAKFAATGYSEGLRAELAREGISVTTIAPGLMRTGSHLNALFKGRQRQEFTWFSLGASLPLISMDAERAARQIVEAALRREPERILSLQANLLARFHALFPGASANLTAAVNTLILPRPPAGGKSAARGQEVRQRLRSPWLDLLTGWGLSAARRFRQLPGPTIDQKKK